VEDDPILVKLVRTAFQKFGFHGNIISAGRVEEALNLLDERERNRKPVNLILVDMKLPDGTGLDVIRHVKTDPAWRMTPVIVLSSELAPGTIDAAYALGANCYVSKNPATKGVFESLHVLYASWLESALLPEVSSRDHLQDALSRAIHLRARTAEFYFSLARVFEGKPEMSFWLDRSLNEGNLANLLAFIQPKLSEKDVPTATIERLTDMQVDVQHALHKAEECLKRTPAPLSAEVYRWVLDFMGALNEEVIAEVIGCFFPKGPEATRALKARAAIQLKELASHILERTKNRIASAGAKVEWAERSRQAESAIEEARQTGGASTFFRKEP
jgi:CheY-like chemotaxis protein